MSTRKNSAKNTYLDDEAVEGEEDEVMSDAGEINDEEEGSDQDSAKMVSAVFRLKLLLTEPDSLV
jgi:hypothetical protein